MIATRAKAGAADHSRCVPDKVFQTLPGTRILHGLLPFAYTPQKILTFRENQEVMKRAILGLPFFTSTRNCHIIFPITFFTLWKKRGRGMGCTPRITSRGVKNKCLREKEKNPLQPLAPPLAR